MIPNVQMDGEGVRGTLNRVVKGEYQMPQGVSLEAQDLISRLLQKVRENPLALHCVEIPLHGIYSMYTLRVHLTNLILFLL